MPTTCSVLKCRSRFQKGNDIRFFNFPFKDEYRLTAWVTAINRQNWIPTKNNKVCSKHFNPHDYLDRPGAYKKYLKNNAIPSLFLSNSACLPEIQEKQITTNKENKDKENEDKKNEDKENVNTSTRMTYENTKNNIETSNRNNEIRKELYPTQISPGTSYVLLVKDVDIDKSTSSNSLKIKKARTMSSYILKASKLHHKIRILKQQICRKNKKINSLKLLVVELKKQVCSKKAIGTESFLVGHTDHNYCRWSKDKRRSSFTKY